MKPIYENSRFAIRSLVLSDWEELLDVYSDVKAVPFFNSDNCNGDDFYYTTPERMKKAVDFWLDSEARGYFVRRTIVDRTVVDRTVVDRTVADRTVDKRSSGKICGTIELFNRRASDYFDNCGLLRLDLGSRYENESDIADIVGLVLTFAFREFHCEMLATKAVPAAAARRRALKALGFSESRECLYGHDNTAYNSYFVLKR